MFCLAIIRTPYKIQNPSEPQSTPRNTPQIPLQNRNAEKIRKIYENHPISYFFRIFAVFRFWRWIWGVFRDVFRGVFWGSEGFCILHGVRMIASFAFFLALAATTKLAAKVNGHSRRMRPWISSSPELATVTWMTTTMWVHH